MLKVINQLLFISYKLRRNFFILNKINILNFARKIKLLQIFFLFLILILLYNNLFAKELKVGGSITPHSEILHFAKPILKKQGIDLTVVEFQDYVLPNIALKNKDIDANLFQHIAYLEAQKKEHNYDFINAGGVLISPIGIYSKNYKTIKDVKNGSTVLFSNSASDRGRILALLESSGLITLKKGKNVVDLDFEDISQNPKNLKFKNDLDPAILPRAYFNNEADLMVINTNFALLADLNPIKDAIFLEEAKDSPFVNIVAVRFEDKNREDIKTLVKVLQSKEVGEFMITHFKGAAIPTYK